MQLIEGTPLVGAQAVARFCGGKGSARSLLVFMALSATSAGCSVNTYKPAVDRFATATQQAQDAYTKMETTVLASHAEELRQQLLRGERRATLKAGSCLEQSKNCE